LVVVVPVEDAPVVPVVDEPLDVVALPEGELDVEDDGSVDDEPLDEPMPEDEPETDEPLDEGEEVDGEEVLLAVLDEGETVPVAEPVEEPMPEAEPVAEPDALGPVELQAASANAQANGKIHLIIFNSLLLFERKYVRRQCLS
jgi:hypothetical protein